MSSHMRSVVRKMNDKYDSTGAIRRRASDRAMVIPDDTAGEEDSDEWARLSGDDNSNSSTNRDTESTYSTLADESALALSSSSCSSSSSSPSPFRKRMPNTNPDSKSSNNNNNNSRNSSIHHQRRGQLQPRHTSTKIDTTRSFSSSSSVATLCDTEDSESLLDSCSNYTSSSSLTYSASSYDDEYDTHKMDGDDVIGASTQNRNPPKSASINPEFGRFKHLDATSYLLINRTKASLTSPYFHQASPLRFYNLSTHTLRTGLSDAIAELEHARPKYKSQGVGLNVIPRDPTANVLETTFQKTRIIHNHPHQGLFLTPDGINIQPLFPTSYRTDQDPNTNHRHQTRSNDKDLGCKLVVRAEWYRMCSITTDNVGSSWAHDFDKPAAQFLDWALEASVASAQPSSSSSSSSNKTRHKKQSTQIRTVTNASANVFEPCQLNFLPVHFNEVYKHTHHRAHQDESLPFVRSFDLWFANALQSQAAPQHFVDASPTPHSFAQWFPLVFGHVDIDKPSHDDFVYSPPPYLLRLTVDETRCHYDAHLASINPNYASWWHFEGRGDATTLKNGHSFIQTPVASASLWNTHALEPGFVGKNGVASPLRDNKKHEMSVADLCAMFWATHRRQDERRDKHKQQFHQLMASRLASLGFSEDDLVPIAMPTITCFSTVDDAVSNIGRRMRLAWSRQMRHTTQDGGNGRHQRRRHHLHMTLQYYKHNISYSCGRHAESPSVVDDNADGPRHKKMHSKKHVSSTLASTSTSPSPSPTPTCLWQDNLDSWATTSLSCLGLTRDGAGDDEDGEYSNALLHPTLVEAMVAHFDNEMLPANADIFNRAPYIPVDQLHVQSTTKSTTPQVLHLGRMSIVYAGTYTPSPLSHKHSKSPPSSPPPPTLTPTHTPIVIKCVDPRFFGDHYAMTTRTRPGNGGGDTGDDDDVPASYPKKIVLPYTIALAIREIKMDLWILSRLPPHAHITKLIGWTTLGGTCLASVTERMDMSFALFVCITDAIFNDTSYYGPSVDYLRACRQHLCTPDVDSDEVCEDILRQMTQVYCEQAVHTRMVRHTTRIKHLRLSMREVFGAVRKTWRDLSASNNTSSSSSQVNTNETMTRNDVVITILWMRMLAIQQLTMGLSHLHNHGFVHRDVKPSNFGVSFGKKRAWEATPNDYGSGNNKNCGSSNSNHIHARLFDFGFGLAMSNIFRTVGGNVKHQPPRFMPPGVHRYMVYEDGACDVYAILCMFVDLLNTLLPHVGSTIKHHKKTKKTHSTKNGHSNQSNGADPETLVQHMHRWLTWADAAMSHLASNLTSLTLHEVHNQSVPCPLRLRRHHLSPSPPSDMLQNESDANLINIRRPDWSTAASSSPPTKTQSSRAKRSKKDKQRFKQRGGGGGDVDDWKDMDDCDANAVVAYLEGVLHTIARQLVQPH